MRSYFISICCLLALSLASVAQAAEPAGLVIAVNPGAFVERAGGREPLQSKSPIYVSDVVVTDATGKVQILFSDDTNVAVGANTRVALQEFVGESGAVPVFNANVASGIARFVTGKIVERNRSGFHIQTPQATIGIRGTTFSVQVSDGEAGKTMVIGHQVSDGFPISVTNAATGLTSQINASGRAVEATPSGNVEMAAPTGHLSQSGSQVRQPVAAASSESQSSDSGSSGSSTASSGPSEGNENPQSSTSASGASSEGHLAISAPSGGTSGGSLSMPSTPDGTIGLGDTGTSMAMTPASLPSAISDTQSSTSPASSSGLTAQYTGTLTNNSLWVGTFSLEANVSSGQVSNAGLNVTGSHSHNFTAVGGSGTIDGSKKFTINNLTITSSTVPAMVTHGSAWMDGKFYGSGDSRVRGDWGSEMNGTPIHNNGKFDGSVAP